MSHAAKPRARAGVAASQPAEGGLFTATHWSLVQRAQDKSEPALSKLCQSYRQPLVVWLRTRGYSPHDAEDIVQGLLLHLLNRDFLKNVSRQKGNFRTFLLTCLKNYLRDEQDKKMAAKRGRGHALESLDETDEEGSKIYQPAAADAAPDREYDRAWANTVLTNSLRRLEQECARQNQLPLCKALEPSLFADETASRYGEIAAQLGMTEGAVKVAAHRVRARLKSLLREEILETVANEQDWRQEVRYLIELFGR